MKAYSLSVKDEDDAGQVIVFANTRQEARKLIYSTDLDCVVDGWISAQARRAKEYDGMENLSPAELAKEQWRNGWTFFDMYYPEPSETTDEEFMDWYNREF